MTEQKDGASDFFQTLFEAMQVALLILEVMRHD
jgi:hypothetical protein